MKMSRNKLRLQRKRRIRAKISGAKARPRLAVFLSLRGIYAQIIDDNRGITLASASLSEAKGKNGITGAQKVGQFIAKKCAAKKIKEVVFDRAGYKYHGKLKALAEAARAGGLKF